MSDPPEISLDKALFEERELKKDLGAFEAASRLVETRLRESMDTERYHELQHWPGAHAVLGSLRLSVTSMRNLLREYHEQIVLLSTQRLQSTDQTKEPLQ